MWEILSVYPPLHLYLINHVGDIVVYLSLHLYLINHVGDIVVFLACLILTVTSIVFTAEIWKLLYRETRIKNIKNNQFKKEKYQPRLLSVPLLIGHSTRQMAVHLNFVYSPFNTIMLLQIQTLPITSYCKLTCLIILELNYQFH